MPMLKTNVKGGKSAHKHAAKNWCKDNRSFWQLCCSFLCSFPLLHLWLPPFYINLFVFQVKIKCNVEILRVLIIFDGNGITTEVEEFFLSASGVWAEWGAWSDCDPAWFGGNKLRFRNCNNAPSPAACDGDPTETAPCSSESTNQPFCQNATNPGNLLKIWVQGALWSLYESYL